MADIIKGFPSTSQNDYQLNVINIIRQAVRSYAKQEIVAQTHTGILRYTYEDAYQRIKRLGNAVKGIGLGVGDRVGVLDWNSHRHFEAYYGIPGIGAVLLLLNLRLPPNDLSYIINHAETSFIFVDETLIPIAEAVADACQTVKGYIIMTDKKLSDIQTKLSPVYSYEELLEQADTEIKWPVMDETSAYGACYTTGTTGKPKGVYYSHRDIYLHAAAISANSEVSFKDCYYQLVPMFHAMGWGTPHGVLMVGAKFVLPGMYNVADLGSLAKLMVDEKVTVTAGAPALFMPMLEYIKKLDQKPDMTGARMLCGASEPPLSMMKEYYELTGAEIVHAYGATETSPLVTLNRIKPWLLGAISDEEKWDLKRKQGFPVVGVDLKIVNDKGETLPHDGKSVGELLIRGPWITGSYYNAPETADQFTENGYWRSGDAGTIDPNGYLKITDRVKDVIKSGGEWISSVDMENEIVAHEAVLESVVTGLPHPKWEERPIALVVLREEFADKVTEDDIKTHLLNKFAKWQLPDRILFVSEIPKTSVGKLNKKEIREKYKDFYMK